jgi:hypothetical protein
VSVLFNCDARLQLFTYKTYTLLYEDNLRDCSCDLEERRSALVLSPRRALAAMTCLLPTPAWPPPLPQ